MDQNESVFREEAHELLSELESSLLELEQNPADNELISKIFRAMHTIKGSGAMFGFDQVAAFTHDIETVYDLLRNGRIIANKELIDLTLTSCDQIRRMIEGQDEADEGEAAKITLGFQEFLSSVTGKPGKDEPQKAEAAELSPLEPADKKVTYRIRFKPHKDIFSRGTNTTLLITEMRKMGVCKFMAQTDEIPVLAELNPEYCYTYWDIMLTTHSDINAVKDVFIFVEDNCELQIDIVDEIGAEDNNEYKKLGEIKI